MISQTQVGTVAIDSGTVAITDPAHLDRSKTYISEEDEIIDRATGKIVLGNVITTIVGGGNFPIYIEVDDETVSERLVVELG